MADADDASASPLFSLETTYSREIRQVGQSEVEAGRLHLISAEEDIVLEPS
jgi:hypothetical protein